MRTSLPLAATLPVLLLLGAWTAPAADLRATAETVSTDPDGLRPFGTETLRVMNVGRYSTETNPAGHFAFAAGLRVGAEIDRGSGIERITSSAAYALDYAAEALPPGRAQLQLVQTDTDTSLFPHEPLGLRVVQHVTSETVAGYDGFVSVRSVVRNISAQWSPPGWDMENVYVGFFMDPDLGRPGGTPWSDDHAAYALTPDGPLAYAFDEPGGGDDTTADVGILLRDHPVHSFRRWNFPGDTESDAGQYLQLRGDSNGSVTIDPDTVVPADYRILLAAGPFALARGEAVTVTFALVTGTDLGAAPPRAGESHRAASFAVAQAGGSRVRFAGLPAGARLFVHDVTGRRVASLGAADGGEVVWDAAREGAASGVYFYRVASPSEDVRGKIVITR